MRSLVLVQSKSPGIFNGLTYKTDDVNVTTGSLVRVELRKKLTEGIVIDLGERLMEDAVKSYELKSIDGVVSNGPLISPAHVKLLQWMAEYYCCSLRGAVTPFLPGTSWKALLPDRITGYRLKQPLETGGKKQLMVAEYLTGKDWVGEDELREHTGASKAVLSALLKNGTIEREDRTDEPVTPVRYNVLTPDIALSDAQRTAYESIVGDSRASLLFGVTGSGKTEVYAALIADAAAQGKQSILLLPEILLTEHSIERFEKLFNREHISVLHSKLTPAAKRAEWKKIRAGKTALVIGSRSALFAPCQNLGLIIIDEEHEWTYKNEQTPRYHARETAEQLCRFAGAKLLLGSATPSLEAWHRAKSGQYHLARLPRRYQDRALPNVRVIDLAEASFGSVYPFTPPLIDAIARRLKDKEQTVLFLNRRGVATSVLCLECRKRIVSQESQLPFTLHQSAHSSPYLLDHLTGTRAELPARCPHCGSPKLHPVGAGTQKIEQVIRSVFPGATVLRADRDTMQSPEDMRGILLAMRERRADILLGTQSVVKGLDLPGVTLAAVLVADVGLSLPHFRAGERIFQLLTQLAGRSGRAIPGDVIIQTFRPEAAEVVAAAQHRTEEYLEAELLLRTTLQYPPETRMIRFTVRGDKPELRARQLHRTLTDAANHAKVPASISIAPTLTGLGREWHVLLRGHDVRDLMKNIDLTGVTVDVDPVDVL